MWGGGWEDAVFTGYLGDTECITRRFVANPVATKLIITADEPRLRTDGPDAVRFVVKLVDQAGNVLPYSSDVVQLKIRGPGQLIGPQVFALIGGVRGFWVRTTGKVGTIKVFGQVSGLKIADASVRVR